MGEDVQELLGQAAALMTDGKFKAAKRLCKQALALDAGNFDAYMHLGNACANLADYKSGADAFKEALLLQPESGIARYSLGCALFLDGNGAEALVQFKACEKAGRASAEMYGIMEVIFLEAKDYVHAICCANHAIQLEPLSPQHYADKAQLLLLSGKTREAVSCLNEAEGKLSDSGRLYILEARVLMRTGEHDAALAAIDRAVARFPLDATVLLEKVHVLNERGAYAQAVELLPRVRELAGEDAALLRELAMQEGIAQAGCKDVDASIGALEGASPAEKLDAEALFLLVNECFAAKRYEQAEHFGTQLAALKGAEPRYRAAGVFYSAASIDEQGRHEEARVAYKGATRTLRQANIAEPGLLEVYAYRAMCHKALGEHEKALALCDHLIAMAPDEPSGYMVKADVYEAMGESERAEQLRAKANEAGPEFRM